MMSMKLSVNILITLALMFCSCIGIHIEDNLPMHDKQSALLTLLLVITTIQIIHCAWVFITE